MKTALLTCTLTLTLTWGQACAAGTLMLVPVFFFTLGMQKFLIRGITAGGVKG